MILFDLHFGDHVAWVVQDGFRGVYTPAKSLRCAFSVSFVRIWDRPRRGLDSDWSSAKHLGMRTLLLLLAGAAAVTAQRAPAPPPPTTPAPAPTAIIHPERLDTLNFDVGLAISGRVLLLEERQPPPEPVPVEFLCHGTSLGALTDAKGRFSIPYGSQQATRTNLVTTQIEIEGCRVQIRVAGFEEVVVTLKKPQRLSDLSLGDLTLKSIGLKGDAGFSATSRDAPGKARSNYVAAFDTINMGHYPQALASLDKALAAYPKYASALELKGIVLERMGQREAAREAYQRAVEADPAYAKPLVQLAEMAAQDQNPTDAARWAALVNRLVPRAFPDVYLIEGSAYCDLHRYDDAEKAARAGIDADPKGIYPGLRRLMGEVLYQKRSYAAALDLFEWYLKEAPEAADIVGVQERVQSCKRLVKTTNR
jgi:TolA-binding protein